MAAGFDLGADGLAARSTAVTKRPVRTPVVDTRERDTIRAAFRSPNGQEALRLLRVLFKHRGAYHTDPHFATYLNGQRSVVEYIEEQMTDE